MSLYQNQSGKLSEIKGKSLSLERDIQRIFEANLDLIMCLEFVKSEFTIKNKRIDTLAYDKQSNAFIIIEYKRDKNNSVVDQGLAYLSLMMENKADFILSYNENLNRSLNSKIRVAQTRAVFVSTSFTENQILSTNFKDFGIELWEVKHYENNTIAINPIKKSVSAESIKPIAKRNNALKEIKVYTVQERLKKASEATIELYERFKTALLNLDSGIEVYAMKGYIGFRKGKKSVSYFVVQQKAIKIIILAGRGKFDDSKKLTLDASKENWGYGSRMKTVINDKDLEYIMSLIRQVIPE